ncbi:MAG: TIGR00730 family Rossman fold protein [Cyclobacteriaceae bacterium]|nr:TIGR00730 family Rossman fold protein [Cyclobacteriaceae bacterium]
MNVCVFCGSSQGDRSIYKEAARALGQALLASNCSLVYGGGNIGLMGIIADEVLAGGGKVIGVIPDFLMKKEFGHQAITQLEVVKSMHERKKRMADLSDAFIALPGGWGTLDELAEILTWKQLGLITQPVGLLNINSFFDHLHAQMNTMVEEGFLQQSNMDMLIVEKIPQSLLAKLGALTV